MDNALCGILKSWRIVEPRQEKIGIYAIRELMVHAHMHYVQTWHANKKITYKYTFTI